LAKPWILKAEEAYRVIQLIELSFRELSWQEEVHLGVLRKAIGQLHAVFPEGVRNQGDPQTGSWGHVRYLLNVLLAGRGERVAGCPLENPYAAYASRATATAATWVPVAR